MTGNRTLIFALCLLALPLFTSFWGLSVPVTLFIIVAMLLWRWGISLSALLKPEQVPDIQLDTISASHFVEKVRWNMDILGIDYEERPVGGTLGVFFIGRTVPQLRIRTGATRSVISNSSDILRYLWGRYYGELQEQAQFLAPTPERLALEKRIDSYGVDLQVWGYYHILDDKEVAQQLWGRNCPSLPSWQRQTIVILFPVLRFLIRKAFRIGDKSYARAVNKIEIFLSDIEQKLTNESTSILSGDQIDYVDISLAAMSGLWLSPEGYGGGKADGVKMERAKLPQAMRDDINRWEQQYPNTVMFIERLYQQRTINEAEKTPAQDSTH